MHNKNDNPISIKEYKRIYQAYLPTDLNPNIFEEEKSKIEIKYDNIKINVPDLSKYEDMTPGSGRISSYEGTLPLNFSLQHAPGTTVELPSPIQTNAEFLGWYYDKNFKYPVERGIYEVGYVRNKIYAKWNVSRVLFELNGGVLLQEPKQYQYFSNYKNVKLVRENYRFDGWYLDSDFENPLPTGLVAGQSIYTLYAKWTPLVKVSLSADIEYKLLNLVGTPGQRIRYPVDIKGKGKVLEGFYNERLFVTRALEFFPEIDITVFVNFTDAHCITLKGIEDKKHKYTYFNVPIVEDVEEIDDLEFKYLYQRISMHLLNEYDPAEDETIFSGWYYDKKFTKEFKEYPSSDVELYAKFSKPIYIKFELNGGTATIFNDTYKLLSLDNKVIVQYEKIAFIDMSHRKWLEYKTRRVMPPRLRV